MSYDIDYYLEDPLSGNKQVDGSKLYREAQIARVNFAKRFVDKNKTVADICCGSGFAAHLLNYNLYYGVEHPQMIDKILKRDLYPSETATFIGYNFDEDQEIKLPEEVDCIISFETIEHPANPEKFLRQLKDCLKPNGLLILTTPNNPYGDPPMSVEHVKEFSLSEMVKLLND